VDERPNPLEERPFAHELGDALRAAVGQVRAEGPPAASLARSLERARRLGPGRVNPWLRYHRAATAAAAAAVLMLTFGLLLICAHFEPAAPPQVAAPGGGPSPGYGDGGTETEVAVSVDHGPGRTHGEGSGYSGAGENPFVETEHNPVSTFPLTADTAAYRDVRRALLEEKRLPVPDSVRVAGLVNAFSYSYPLPENGDPVSLTLDLAECPWNSAHHLARVGLRARPDAAVEGAAVRVAFNPRRVAAYRLIGYEGRGSRQVGGDALGPGRSVTALYEIVPGKSSDESEWLTVQMRYRNGPSGAIRALSGPAVRFAEAPADFRFAAAAAEFGLLLRDSEYKGRAAYAAVRAAARAALGADPDGRRAEFLALVDAADRLTAERKLTRADAGRQLIKSHGFDFEDAVDGGGIVDDELDQAEAVAVTENQLHFEKARADGITVGRVGAEGVGNVGDVEVNVSPDLNVALA